MKQQNALLYGTKAKHLYLYDAKYALNEFKSQLWC